MDATLFHSEHLHPGDVCINHGEYFVYDEISGRRIIKKVTVTRTYLFYLCLCLLQIFILRPKLLLINLKAVQGLVHQTSRR